MTWWWVNETNSSKILSESDKTLVHSTHSVSCVYCGLLLDTSLNCCILVYIKTLSSARRLATHSLTAPCQDQTQSRLNAYTHTCSGLTHQILGSIVARQCEGQSGAWMGWDKASQTLSLMRWITRHAPLGIANHKTVCLFSVHIYRLSRQQSDPSILTNINPAAIICEPAGCASHVLHCRSGHATGTFVWTGLNLIGILRHTTEAVKRW